MTLPKRTRKAPAEAGAFFRGSLGANNSLIILCYSHRYDGPILATGGQHDAPVLSRVEEVYTMFQILVVEDDRELNKTVCSYLNQNG